MLQNEPYYRIFLEDYSDCRHSGSIRAYYGTRKDLMNFANQIGSHQGADHYFRPLIEAIDRYPLDPDITHTAAGHELRLLDPVEYVAEHEFHLENHRWVHPGHGDIMHHMHADDICIHRILFRLEDGTMVRTICAVYENLQVCAPSFGWCSIAQKSAGFPGMVGWMKGYHYLTLHAQEAAYSAQQLPQATADLMNPNTLNLTIPTLNIMGCA